MLNTEFAKLTELTITIALTIIEKKILKIKYKIKQKIF